MASDAEERIRAKAEAALRRARPDARIIHEVVLTQGGCRIDLAAVWSDGMILCEVKSERDVLDRLRAQLDQALVFRVPVWLCVAEKWREHVVASSNAFDFESPIPIVVKGQQVGTTYQPNPNYMADLSRVDIWWETEDGLEPPKYPIRNWSKRTPCPEAFLDMLWADELRGVTGQGPRANRTDCIAYALEHLTGRQIRQRACQALLRRPFPRADAPVETTPQNGVIREERGAIHPSTPERA